MKKFTNKKGFTLVEMLIVVAIIAVLAAIAIPSGLNALDKANEATDEANLRTAQTLAAVKAVEIAEDNTDTASHSFYLNLSAAGAPKLVEVDNAWADDVDVDPVDSNDPEATTADQGISEANQGKLIRVDINQFGEITGVKWYPES